MIGKVAMKTNWLYMNWENLVGCTLFWLTKWAHLMDAYRLEVLGHMLNGWMLASYTYWEQLGTRQLSTLGDTLLKSLPRCSWV